jgi:hypothetical protein
MNPTVAANNKIKSVYQSLPLSPIFITSVKLSSWRERERAGKLSVYFEK